MGTGGGALAVIFRLLLIALNIVFVLVGLAIMACGIVVKFFLGTIVQSALLTGFVKDAFDKVNPNQSIPKYLDFGTFTNSAGLILIVLGAIIFGISIFACCGACYKWRPFLIIFCCLVIVLVIGEIASTALIASKSSPVHKTARDELLVQLKKYKVDGSDGFSATMNLLMLGMKCCGINGQDDFKSLDLKYKSQTIKVPPTCCKIDEKTEEVLQCDNNPSNANSHSEGCYDVFLDALSSGNSWAIPIVVGLMITQVLEVLFAAFVIRDIGKGSVGPV